MLSDLMYLLTITTRLTPMIIVLLNFVEFSGSYGRVLKGGIPDKMAAARLVLKDWNTGKIPYYTIPPKDAGVPEKSDDAVIVSSFGKEFDLAKFDDTVLSSLKDRDEMDFVQMDEDKEVLSKTETEWKKASEFMMRDSNSDDDDDDMEMEDDTPQSSMKSRLAQAGDYDFDAME